jgi:hypothetical protein
MVENTSPTEDNMVEVPPALPLTHLNKALGTQNQGRKRGTPVGVLLVSTGYNCVSCFSWVNDILNLDCFFHLCANPLAT